MLNHTFHVQIGDKRYSPEFQTKEIWQNLLKRAYNVSLVSCCCPSRGDRLLSVKHRAGKYHLARFPGTGASHANECRFYAPSPESSGMQCYAKGVIEEGDDAQLRIRLARGFQILPAREETVIQPEAAPVPGVRKPAMTLLGLLHLLWQEARVNVWYPAMEGKRNLFVVARALSKAAARINAGRVSIDDVLLVPARKESPAAKTNEEKSAHALERSQRLLIVTPLARFDQEKHGGEAGVERLPLSWPFGMPGIFLQDGQWGRLHQQFRKEISAWMRGGQVIVIAQVEIHPGKHRPYGKAIDIALMPVSDQWIPFDSTYEALIELKLRDEGRAFEKPLRFEAEDDCVFPDFWLLDTGETCPMEVFGMATPEYLARKQIKVQHYNREYGVDGWWSWNAYHDTKGLQIPQFPARRSNRK